MQMGLNANETDRFGATPLYYICRLADDPKTVVILYRFLLSKGTLNTVIDTLFLPGYRNTKKSSLHRHIWRIPSLFELVVDELVPDFYQSLESRFSGVIWQYVDPSVLLKILQHKSLLSSADFRKQLPESFESSLHNFSKVYFQNAALHAAIKCDALESWRVLARWIFSGIHVRDLCRTGEEIWEYNTPLICGLINCSWSAARSSQHTRRQLSVALEIWLEDLQACGTDLEEYGRCELALFQDDAWLRDWRWSYLELGPECANAKGPQLESFSFGPQPGDWVFRWDDAVEEFVREFWELVDDTTLPIPGAWVDDEG